MKTKNEMYKDYLERKYGPPTADTVNNICMASDTSIGLSYNTTSDTSISISDKPMNWFNDFTFTVKGRYISPYEIEKVIVNDPAVIILWRDKTKTVVKCQDDIWDIEKAIAMCFVKKALGNKGNYYNHIRDALNKCKEKEAYDENNDTSVSFIDALKAISNK